jgi:hypothetical protein
MEGLAKSAGDLYCLIEVSGVRGLSAHEGMRAVGLTDTVELDHDLHRHPSWIRLAVSFSAPMESICSQYSSLSSAHVGRMSFVLAPFLSPLS